jgi:HAD superfamily phosphoserine phosphatase-like hydrolase
MKYAFFDFCGTITKYQTADRFVYYVLKNTKYKNRIHLYLKFFIKLLRFKYIFKFLNKIFNVNLLRKKLILLQLKGINRNIIESLSIKYYNDLKKEFNKSIIKKIKIHSKTHKLILVSAGYEPYIKHFYNEYNMHMLFTNEFSYHNNIFTGKMSKIDVYGENKVKVLNDDISDYDYLNSFSYSDCISDLPLLKFSNNGYVISSIKHNWITRNNLKWIKSDL